MVYASNPILSGFYPDPSICVVGADFYLVHSTFAYFPGVPIFHSRDLAHWEQIGNVLERQSQLPLAGCGHSEGIFAPVIRFHHGTFYMISTNVSAGGNFIVTAIDPAGPWSEPYFLGEAAPGIDPSLFFDGDGKCYYVGTRPSPEGVRWNGDWEIWAQELDLTDMKLTGESHKLWNGALHQAIWPEGPHLYKKDGYYYLIIAEGGTGSNHAITAARSREVFGSYENNPNNPILTHRHLGKDYPVVYVGHGDMVEDKDSNWYMVMLASRPCQGYSNMGRETFLAKVGWEKGWPVVNPGIGILEVKLTLPFDPFEPVPENPVYSFYSKKLAPSFLMLRNPAADMYSINRDKGILSLKLQPETLREAASPSYVALRQRSQDYQAGTLLYFSPAMEGESAGIAVVQSNTHHIRFEKCMDKKGMKLCLIRCLDGEDTLLASCEIPSGDLIMKVVSRGQQAGFCYEIGGERRMLAENVDIHFLSTEVSGGFVGCTVGMYASANGRASGNRAEFGWFFSQNL